ncbi:MAG TPA: glycosyltransferase [Terriglobia bacterium]|nr:glycosyltransferase [Terriglobia bacterium]
MPSSPPEEERHESAAFPPPATPLTILVVSAMYPHAENPGYGAFVMHQVEGLRRLGHDVDVLDFPGYRSKLEYVKAAVRVAIHTRQKRYSLVHAHYGITGLTTLFRASVPLVLTVHGSDALVGWLSPAITRTMSRLADATIIVSNGIGARIHGEKIPCGVDLSVFHPRPQTEARARLGLQPGRKYVLFPFNPARRVKRHDLAAAAIQRLAERGEDIELLTVWKATYEEMPWYYNAADAMILCSDSEGSPTAIKEALACNLPVVSVDVGDAAEIMEGIRGAEIVGQTVDDLTQGLNRALARPAGYRFDGRTAMERYSQQETVSAIVRVYRRVIEDRTSGASDPNR